MKAVISIYKSDAVNYLNEQGIKREDALIITTAEDLQAAKGKVKSVHLISAPLGVSDNEEDLATLLVAKAPVTPPKAPVKEVSAPVKEEVKVEKEPEVKEESKVKDDGKN